MLAIFLPYISPRCEGQKQYQVYMRRNFLLFLIAFICRTYSLRGSWKMMCRILT